MTDTLGPKSKPLIVYHVVEGPCEIDTPSGRILWAVEAKVSDDNGKTVQPMVFSFEEKDQAAQFKHDVNMKMEPTVLGDEEDE